MVNMSVVDGDDKGKGDRNGVDSDGDDENVIYSQWCNSWWWIWWEEMVVMVMVVVGAGESVLMIVIDGEDGNGDE